MANTNGFEGVPWMVGGGAKHSADVGRLLGYLATAGSEGVVLPTDWKVTPSLPTANAQVHVGPGAGGIVNRSPGVTSQSYAARSTAVSDLDVAPTGGSARSDLVVIRIKDPQFAPWTAYDPVTQATQVQNGPYAFPEIISGVAANTTDARSLGLTQSMYAVARIDMPAGASTVQASYIKDLRKLIQPKRDVEQLVSAQPPADQRATATAFARWITPASFPVAIPEWATHYIAELDVTNIIHFGPNVFGNLGLYLNGTLVANSPYASETDTGAPANATKRVPIQMAITNGKLALPAGYAGTTKTFDLYAYRDATVSGYFTTDIQTRAILKITWLQMAI